MEENKMIEVRPDGWMALLSDVAVQYGDGKLIRHEWLKKRFNLEVICFEDFETIDDFLEARKNQQFDYMKLVDKLRWDLLKEYKMYMRSMIGDGYMIVRPEDQTQYGYDSFIDDVKKAIRIAGLIMNNVQKVDVTQQAKDNDLRAKFGVMKQMLGSIKSSL